MTTAQYERAQLATLLTDLGPDAPTLCDGWTTRDLAAHLVIRERRADASIGIAVAPLAGHTESVRRGYADKPYDRLVTMVREGAPRWSVFGWSPVDKLLNTTEYLVHHEDVRRAQPGWAPRELPPQVQDAVWQAVIGRSRLALRKVSCGVELRRLDGTSTVAHQGEPRAVVTGEPVELLLYLFGRGEHARVEISGPADAQQALAGAMLAV
jgi:uncharacterized protein (TIGR03085 family)